MDKKSLFIEFETIEPQAIYAFMDKHPNDYDFPNASYSDFKEWFLKFQKEWNETCTAIDNKLNLL